MQGDVDTRDVEIVLGQVVNRKYLFFHKNFYHDLQFFALQDIYISLLGYGVIGNTTDFDSVILGSSPSSPTINIRTSSAEMKFFVFSRVPMFSRLSVRILGLLDWGVASTCFENDHIVCSMR